MASTPLSAMARIFVLTCLIRLCKKIESKFFSSFIFNFNNFIKVSLLVYCFCPYLFVYCGLFLFSEFTVMLTFLCRNRPVSDPSPSRPRSFERRPPCVPLASPLRPPCVPLASPLRSQRPFGEHIFCYFIFIFCLFSYF